MKADMGRVQTGIPDLDLILGGGLEPGSLVILAGAPGTGKTILAQQICFANATPEHKALYYTTLSEPHTKLVRHLEPFDFFKPAALETKVDFIHLGELVQEAGTEGLEPVVTEVVRKCFETRPAVVVIDSAKALRDFVSESELRTALYGLASRVAHTEAVLLLVGEYTPHEIEGGVEFSLADGILQLAYEAHEPVDRRWLRVVKMRGGDHLVGKHSFRIGARGFEVFPRLETLAPKLNVPADGRVPSGTPRLDELMGEGIRAGQATAVLGPSGAGKTIFGLRFAAQGLEAGEHCLYVSFQETADQLVKNAATFGWDLAKAWESGQLAIHYVPVGELDLDTIAAAVRRELTKGSVRRVVIDSLAELVFAAREADRFPAYSRSLVGWIRAAGASVVITSETTTLGPMTEPIGGLSFLFHNVILLRYLEIGSELRRAVNIIKMRTSNHDKGVFEYVIDQHGLTIKDRLEGVTGVLGWSALRTQQ
ncbi:MAG: ATPase domain-containing protein [Candidatus Dormiibacterota bacterium]